MRINADHLYVGVSAGAYPWIPVDQHLETFAVSYAVFHASGPGQVSANIEGTFDDVTNRLVTSARAFVLVTANPSTGQVQDGVITQAVQAIRYRATVVSASSNIVFQLLQAGN